MARQNKKQKRKQIRKVRVKQERSRRQALPALLRKDPLLRNALNHRHPLADCCINVKICEVIFLSEPIASTTSIRPPRSVSWSISPS